MKNNWNQQPIGSIVARIPTAAAYFRTNKIDFCCGGHRPLGEVLAELGLDDQSIGNALDELEAAAQLTAGQTDFTAMDAADLADYIEVKHHSYLKQALPELSEIMTVVLKAHGAHHPDLFKLHGLYSQLRADLEQHLVKEEVMLFPLIEADNAADQAEQDDLTRQIKAEHEAAGALLKTMRRLANDYVAPQDACPTYRRLLAGLVELEGDLFQHIHLENNILLKGGDEHV